MVHPHPPPRALTAALAAALALAPLAAPAAAPRSALKPREPSSARSAAPATAPAALVIVATPPAALPVPDPASQARAQKMLREVYREEYLRPDAASRRALARRLLDQADAYGGGGDDDPAARYVLLCEAREVAASAGDVTCACSAVGRLGRLYAVELPPMLADALSAAARSPHAAVDPGQQVAAASAALDAVERAVAADDFASALRLASLAEAAGRKGRSPALVHRAEQRLAELRSARDEHDRLRELARRVAGTPAGSAARASSEEALAAGRFLCLTKGDWAAGLPLLASCSDARLASAAQHDLAAGSDGKADPARRAAAAEAWWDLAQAPTCPPPHRRHLLARAALRYRQALPSLSGLTRALAEKRLAEADEEALAHQGYAPGLVTELFKGVAFETLAGSRLDAQVDFDWSDAAPDPALPKDHFSLRLAGFLRVARPGRYELVAIANTGVKVTLAGRVVLDEPDLVRKQKGARRTVELPAGLLPVRIDYFDTTGTARLRLLWQPPGASAPIPIPAEAFYHDRFLAPAGAR